MALLLAQQEQLLCEIVDAVRAMHPDNPQLRATTGGRSGGRVFLQGRQRLELDGRRPHADISELEAKGFLRRVKTEAANAYFAVTAEAHAERDRIAKRDVAASSIKPSSDKVLDTKGWVPDERELDRGANSVVYIARRDQSVAVLKVCSAWRAEAERYQRFISEIQALKEFTDLPGVMRILDSEIPESGRGRFPWYVMPEGVPLSKLRVEAPLDEVVPGLVSIAETLLAMHNRGYSHRDVKPSNLFVMADGTYVVGDLGLVGVPAEIRDSLTREGGSLGPANYMAPEMVEYVPGTDARPADVYSLAKTTWALVAKRSYPLPGHQRFDDRESLAALTGEDRAGDLDRLIQAATEHDPRRRPTMVETATELNAWVEAHVGERDDHGEDELTAAIAEARARLSNQLDRAHSAAADRAHATEAFGQLSQAMNPIVMSLSQIGATAATAGADQMLDATLGHPFLEEMGRPLIGWRDHVFAYAQVGEEHMGVRLAVAYATALYEDQSLVSAVGILVYEIPPTLGSDGFMWHDSFAAGVGTLTVRQETQRLVQNARAQMPAAIARFSDLAERL